MFRSTRRPSQLARAAAVAVDRPPSRRHTGYSPRLGPHPLRLPGISYEDCSTFPLKGRHRAMRRSGTTPRSPPR